MMKREYYDQFVDAYVKARFGFRGPANAPTEISARKFARLLWAELADAGLAEPLLSNGRYQVKWRENTFWQEAVYANGDWQAPEFPRPNSVFSSISPGGTPFKIGPRIENPDE